MGGRGIMQEHVYVFSSSSSSSSPSQHFELGSKTFFFASCLFFYFLLFSSHLPPPPNKEYQKHHTRFCAMFRKSLSIQLVEPVVYLRGHPKDKHTINILRGLIRLQLSHPAIIQSVTIQFVGTAKTLWPEGNTYDTTTLQHPY